MDLRDGLLFFLILVSSLCIHEWAHAWVADKLGDPTPHNEGRVTLNPAAHIDLVGTILFPLFCIFASTSGFFLGWARPVSVNASYFKHPGRDDTLVTLAGPLSNFALTLLAAIVGALTVRFFPQTVELAGRMIEVNAWLFVFNMLPIPPLDGGRILRYFVGMSWETFAMISRWSMFVLLGVLFFSDRIKILFAIAIGIAATPAEILFKLLT